MVDVLDIDGALVDAGAAGRARPQGVLVDDRAVLVAVPGGVVAVGVLVRDAIARPDERALHGLLDGLRHGCKDGLVDLADRKVGTVIGLLSGQDVRRLREGSLA